MEIREITYKRTVNLGDYENESFEMVGVLKTNENPAMAATALRQFVCTQLGLNVDALTTVPKVKERPEKVRLPNEEKEVPTVIKDVESKTPVEIETPEVVAETPVDKKPKKKVSRKKTVKEKKPTTINYSRDSKEHKDLVRSVLTSVCPDWKITPENKATAIQCSKELEGKPLLSENGELLPSFVELVSGYFEI